MRSVRPQAVVVGAGVVGASMAYHLAKRGASVTLVDQGQPAGEATGKAFAWINVSHGLPEPYFQLRHHAIQEYRRLERELKYAFRVNWSGALTWKDDPADTDRFVHEHAAWGYDVRLIGRNEIAALEPNLGDVPEHAAFAAGEGGVEPAAVTHALVRAAREAGAQVRLDAEVLAVDTDGNRVIGILTRKGMIAADVVVLAAGVMTTALCRPLGLAIPLDSSPAILLRFRTKTCMINTVVSNSHMEIRQLSDTIMLGAEDYIDNSTENGPTAVAKRALAQITRCLVGGEDVDLIGASVGMRPIPQDGLPIIGYAPGIEGLYVTVMHAGITLAPAIGRLASAEIVDGVEEGFLSSCRATRFMN